MYENAGAGLLESLIVVVATIISLTILFVLVRAAVVQGMNAHYKTVRR